MNGLWGGKEGSSASPEFGIDYLLKRCSSAEEEILDVPPVV